MDDPDKQLAEMLADMQRRLRALETTPQPFWGDWFDIPIRIIYNSNNYFFEFEDGITSMAGYFAPGELVRIKDPVLVDEEAYYYGYVLGIDDVSNLGSFIFNSIGGIGGVNGKIPTAWQSLPLEISSAIGSVPSGHIGSVNFTIAAGLNSSGGAITISDCTFSLTFSNVLYKLLLNQCSFTVGGSHAYVDLELPIDYEYLDGIFYKPIFSHISNESIVKLTSNGSVAKLARCYLHTMNSKNYIRVATHDASTMTGNCVLEAGTLDGKNVSRYSGT